MNKRGRSNTEEYQTMSNLTLSYPLEQFALTLPFAPKVAGSKFTGHRKTKNEISSHGPAYTMSTQFFRSNAYGNVCNE